jgi:hypothetical protein
MITAASKRPALYKKQVVHILDDAFTTEPRAVALGKLRRLIHAFELAVTARDDQRLEPYQRPLARLLLAMGLLNLIHNGRVTEQQLSDATGLPRKNVRGAVDYLTKLGYVVGVHKHSTDDSPSPPEASK